MAIIYMLAQEGRTGTYFKVGYTAHMTDRERAYIVHNPGTKLLGAVEVYAKTKRELEHKLHTAIQKKGYEFIKGQTGKRNTEWFFVPADQEKEWIERGLNMFAQCARRKVMDDKAEMADKARSKK